MLPVVLFFQAEDGIRDLVRSRGLGDVYKRQDKYGCTPGQVILAWHVNVGLCAIPKSSNTQRLMPVSYTHLTLPTSDLV